MIRLSILIPSIPSRFERAMSLYNKIETMCIGLDVEILLFMDNKKRTIGEKREALKNLSKGKYFMFVDDDDSLLSVKEIYEATEKDVDVITFWQVCLNSNGSEYFIDFGLKNPIEHNTDENGNYVNCLRPPFHCCAWSSWFKKIKYPAINYGEDGVWVLKSLKHANVEHHINEVLHAYNFHPQLTEASTESNKYWTNPNESNS